MAGNWCWHRVGWHRPSASRCREVLPPAPVAPCLLPGIPREGSKLPSPAHPSGGPGQGKGGDARCPAGGGGGWRGCSPSLALQGRMKLLDGRCWRGLAGAAGPTPSVLCRGAPGPKDGEEDSLVPASRATLWPTPCPRGRGSRAGGEGWRPSPRPLGASAGRGIPQH